jgi:deoxyribodipyrimidine photolyase-related protein
MTIRWLFADQLGPHFTDDHDGELLVVESRAVLRRRRYHRQKAHLLLTAMRRRVAELRDSGRAVTFIQADTYRDALSQVDGPLEVVHPTSHAALRFVRRIAERRALDVLPARGFVTTMEEFASWAEGRGRRRLLMEDFYRESRRRRGVLLDDRGEPAGGRWNFDAENREPPPRSGSLGVDEPWWPDEDGIDVEVRRDLDGWAADGRTGISFLGQDGPRRFAATPAEAQTAVADFLDHRLEAFGTYEDAVLADDPWMAHSLVSAPLNLGLLDPLDVVHQAEERWRVDGVRLASVEGFVRQVMGWRDYIWHLYWHLGEDYRRSNRLDARRQVPDWFAELDGGPTRARCLSRTLDDVARHGWVHHIPRLMILGSYALQRGWKPTEVTDWFHRAFVDGYDWVMVPNVVGMSQHADGGVLATKPYTSGGAYLDTMTDYCGGCELNPKVRVGEDACPFSAGYWWFLDRHRERFAGNQRMARAVSGLDRLKDLPELVQQEDRRGSRAP